MLLRRVRQYIKQHDLMPPGVRVLVGLSGGVDSVVLMYVLKHLDYLPVAAHVNYQLRGEASDGDEAFVRSYCDRLGVACHVERIDMARRAGAQEASLQEAARAIRYRVYARLADAEGLSCVALAHHLDDQAETMLLHLLRGTGPEGLAGMPVQRPLAPGSAVMLVRPLLGTRRAEIEAFARDEGLTWREDESNQSLAYQRNVLRHAVLPVLEKHFGEAISANIARSATLVREYVDATFQRALTEHFDRAAAPEARCLKGDALVDMASVWRRRVILEALKRWLPAVPRHAALAEEIEALVEAQPGRRVAMKGGTVWREREGLVFMPPGEALADLCVFQVYPGEAVPLDSGLLRVDRVDNPPARLDAGAPATIYADADRLVFPLAVRRWQPGDRFQPLGMAGAKKVSDFLTDEKVPAHRRAGVWVLVSGGEIAWVVGMRMAEGVRVQPGTTRVIKFTYIQSE